MQGTDSDDPFWDIELRGRSGGASNASGGRSDALWLVPTSEDEQLMDYDPDFCEYFDLCTNNVFSSDSSCFKNHITISVHEVRDTGVLDTIGGELWEACFYMCAYILIHPEIFANTRALELGSGLGLPALLLAKLKSYFLPSYEGDQPPPLFDVCCTDNDLSLLTQLCKTVGSTRNEVEFLKEILESSSESLSPHQRRRKQVRFGVKTLDWSAYLNIQDDETDSTDIGTKCNESVDRDGYKTPLRSQGIMEGALRPRIGEGRLPKDCCDLIFGSALVYSPSHIAVAYVLRHFLSGTCKEVIIIQIRDRPGFSLFLDRLTSLGLHSEMLDLSDEIVGAARSIRFSSVASQKCDEITKEFRFGVDLLDKWFDLSGYDKNSEAFRKESNQTSHGRFVGDILKTNPSAFCILRVSK